DRHRQQPVTDPGPAIAGVADRDRPGGEVRRMTLSPGLRDDGSAALEAVIVIPALLALLALAVIGMRVQVAGGSIEGAAHDAARAAGQAIDRDQAAATGDKVIDPAQAVTAGRQYLTAAGVTGTVAISADRQQVTVTVQDHYDTVFLGILGYGRLPVEGHGA